MVVPQVWREYYHCSFGAYIICSGDNPATCGANGRINFTFTNVPDGTYTITDAAGTLTNVTVAAGTATVTAPAGTYNNLTITVGGCTSVPGVNVTITALRALLLSAAGVNPATCGANGTIDFTLTNVPNGTYTITYATGSFTNVAVAAGLASVSAPAGNIVTSLLL